MTRHRGAAPPPLAITAFDGNDAERVLRIITSQEGRKLSQLELAEGYKRLAAFGWSNEQIAKKMGRTRQHVNQVMVIGNANTDVQRMVASGEVVATTAVKAVRQHGEKAGKVLGDKLKQVQVAGGSKVTPKAIRDPQVPRALLDDMHRLCKSIAESFPPQVRAAIGEGAEVITLTMKASQVERLVDLVRAADEALTEAES